MINILCYFFIYAFLGWCTEVVYAAVKTGKFVNRGFLNGPYCPIYGAGVILVLYLLDPVKNNIFYLFLGSILITSTIELIGGFVLKKIFHHTWWDYSNMPFNIGGYICLQFSLIWGIACLVVVDRIHPLISYLVNWIPQRVNELFLIMSACLYIVDLVSTIKSILKLNRKLALIDEITSKIKETSDNLGEDLANGAIALSQKKEDMEESFEAKKEAVEEGFEARKEVVEESIEAEKKTIRADIDEMKYTEQKAFTHQKQTLIELRKSYRELMGTQFFGQKRLLKAFPGLKSIDYKDSLEKLRKTILNGFNNNGTEANRKQDRISHTK